MKLPKLIFFILILVLLFSTVANAEVGLNSSGKYTNYNNSDDGYAISYPENWTVNESQKEAVVTFMVDGQFKLNVYHQPLTTTVSANVYIGYSNRQIIQGKSGVELLRQRRSRVKNYSTQEFSWKRPYLAGIPNDLNYYREVNLILKDRVYTFIMKSSEEHFPYYSKQLDQVLNSFRVIPRTKSLSPEIKGGSVEEIRFAGKDLTFTIPENGLVWGAFLPGALVSSGGDQKMIQLEQDLNHKFDFLMTYFLFGDPFPKAMLDKATEQNRIFMLTWQPWWTKDGQYHATPDIAGGVYDEYIREWARAAKEFGNPIFLRISNEMNGDWDPWCVWFLSFDHDIYIESWRRIHRIFKEEGADNVQFVWNPHDRSYPDFRWNNPHLYYPGDEYVDWIGLTGYNNGTSYPADIWRDFDQIHRPLYDDYCSKYPDKPFIIGEFSCNEVGGDKAAWIEQGFASLAKNYPKIRIAVWFNAVDNRWLYNIDSSLEAKEAFGKALENPYFVQGTVKKNHEVVDNF